MFACTCLGLDPTLPAVDAAAAVAHAVRHGSCDAATMAAAAPTCKAVGTAALRHAKHLLAMIDLDLSKLVSPKLGLFPRLAALRAFEGLKLILLPGAEARGPALQSFGARIVGPGEGADLFVADGKPPDPAYDDDEVLEGPVGVHGAALDFLFVAPWVSAKRSFKNGAELSDAEAAELFRACAALDHGNAATVESVKAWVPDGTEVCWQDLELRTHANVGTGDVA